MSDAQWQQGVRGAKRGHNMQAGAPAQWMGGWLVEIKVVAQKIKVNVFSNYDDTSNICDERSDKIGIELVITKSHSGEPSAPAER